MGQQRILLAAATALALSACGDGSQNDAGDAPMDNSERKAELAQQSAEGKADWAWDPCERYGFYGDGDCDWWCLERDTDCDVAPLFDAPKGDATRLPILLAHGFDASHDETLVNRWAFHRVTETLKADGHAVCEADVPPYAGIPERATHLKAALEDCLQTHDATQVNIVAHSMGGLDSRYLISTLDQAERVASLTTLSTAHRGTYIADALLFLLPELADPLVNAVVSLWGKTYSDLSEDSDLRAALEGLAEASAADFNAQNPDAAGVYYQSWAGVSHPLGLSRDRRLQEECGSEGVHFHAGTMDRTHATLAPLVPLVTLGTHAGLNDGMISVASSRWGKFRGCIPADHMDEVGQYRNDGPNKHTGFDHLRFYRSVAFDLAAQGF